ncbi:response regulator [Sediminibacterium soli]|uniref:response regulator n=1 Tax=Sediminibacterium soli TaxID=2698829 RepID=UPI00137AA670|nr:response regulator [Sediminibacterium soli]NCI46141.1 response regulator [Sediminibacterium soli]
MAARILIAEDNPINQKLIGLLFQKAGIEPVIVGDGLQAFHAACSQPFDLIFMDVMMPEMDGITATEQILANATDWKQPVIIAMTASMDEEQEQELLAAGMKDHLNKPFTLQALQDTLAKWLPEGR